jgi:hypothetical protein
MGALEGKPAIDAALETRANGFRSDDLAYLIEIQPWQPWMKL